MFRVKDFCFFFFVTLVFAEMCVVFFSATVQNITAQGYNKNDYKRFSLLFLTLQCEAGIELQNEHVVITRQMWKNCNIPVFFG